MRMYRAALGTVYIYYMGQSIGTLCFIEHQMTRQYTFSPFLLKIESLALLFKKRRHLIFTLKHYQWAEEMTTAYMLYFVWLSYLQDCQVLCCTTLDWFYQNPNPIWFYFQSGSKLPQIRIHWKKKSMLSLCK